jgi:phospholipase C
MFALATAAATALAIVALAGGAQAKPASACGTRTRPPATYAHVIWIWMENRSYRQIIGSSEAKYVNSLARRCGLAMNYAAVTHPSLPNYIAATSGGTQGITDDGPPPSHPLSVVSLFEQAGSAKSYQESMPSACRLTDAGMYAVKHNPGAYYTRIRSDCSADNLPLGAFAGALRRNTLPRFSFVTPNLCNDMHDCSVKTGDAWLESRVPAITASPSYRAGKTALFIVWDEDDGSSANKVAALVVSPYTAPGTRSATAFTHYSLLRTTEALLGISTYLGNAASAAGMRSAFGL